MTLADRTIQALRTSHDRLAGVVPSLPDDHLATTSGAAEWTVAQVLSHLGSGAEIAYAGVRAALASSDVPGQEFNESVWDRWNALSPRDQATSFLERDAELVDALDGLSPDDREGIQVKLGFLPGPIALTTVLGMRLSEVALHSWDVQVTLDPAAVVDATSAGVLIEQYSGGLGFMLGFSGRADQLTERAVVEVPAATAAVVIDDQVSLVKPPVETTARFSGAPEALVRLMAGRLTPLYTPAEVEVTGSVTIDDLRRVFPGY